MCNCFYRILHCLGQILSSFLQRNNLLPASHLTHWVLHWVQILTFINLSNWIYLNKILQNHYGSPSSTFSIHLCFLQVTVLACTLESPNLALSIQGGPSTPQGYTSTPHSFGSSQAWHRHPWEAELLQDGWLQPRPLKLWARTDDKRGGLWQ